MSRLQVVFLADEATVFAAEPDVCGRWTDLCSGQMKTFQLKPFSATRLTTPHIWLDDILFFAINETKHVFHIGEKISVIIPTILPRTRQTIHVLHSFSQVVASKLQLAEPQSSVLQQALLLGLRTRVLGWTGTKKHGEICDFHREKPIKGGFLFACNLMDSTASGDLLSEGTNHNLDKTQTGDLYKQGKQSTKATRKKRGATRREDCTEIWAVPKHRKIGPWPIAMADCRSAGPWIPRVKQGETELWHASKFLDCPNWIYHHLPHQTCRKIGYLIFGDKSISIMSW